MKRVDPSKSMDENHDRYSRKRPCYHRELSRSAFEKMLKNVDTSLSSEEVLSVKVTCFNKEITYFGRSRKALKRKRSKVYDGRVLVRKLRRHFNWVVNQPPPIDFLGANQLGKKELLGSHGKGRVDVETLRGKIIGLYFTSLGEEEVPPHLIESYNTLKKTKHDSFEMIFVVLPSKESDSDQFYYPSFFDRVISRVPCPIVPFTSCEDWRSYLYTSYGNPYSYLSQVTFIDTKDNTVNVLSHNVLPRPFQYGPHSYPFTKDRLELLDAQHKQLGKKTFLQDIIGSESRDYVIDSQSNKVPISLLENKDVLLYAYNKHVYKDRFVEQLREIYCYFPRDRCEIVSINLDFNCGPEDEEAFKLKLAETPWLSLPFGDDKIWSLRQLMGNHPCIGCFYDYPILFVKPKGISLLDPWGSHVIKYFGIEAYPFTRWAAAHSLMIKQAKLSFNSFVTKAGHLDLDFNSLIQNKKDGCGTEEVSLPKIMEKRPTAGVLLFFASKLNCSEERLTSLMDAYSNQKESSSFEVIFVSSDKDADSFLQHFSVMPWFAFPRPLKRKEVRILTESTVGIDYWHENHFLAFGPEGSLLKAGLVTKPFRNCDFPFIMEAEWIDHLAYLIEGKYGWSREADWSTGHKWATGLEYSIQSSSIDEDKDPRPDLDVFWYDEDLPESLLKKQSAK